MSSEKRLALFLVLTFTSILTIQFAMEKTGLVPPPRPRPPVAEAKPAEDKDKDKGKDEGPAKPAPEVAKAPAAAVAAKEEKEPEGEPAGPPKVEKPKVEMVPASELVLGSVLDKAPDGYRLRVELEQVGAGVALVASSRYEAERLAGQPRHLPLAILRYDPKAPPSLALSLVRDRAKTAAGGDDEDDEARKVVITPEGGDVPLDALPWEVVRDDAGRAVRAVTKPGPDNKGRVEGQEIEFRTTVDDLGVAITKRFRLFKGEDGFDLELGFESPQQDRAIVYRLLGPHGVPIEGEWYTGTFRDVFFGQTKGTKTEVVTKSAYDVAKPKAPEFDNTALPLRFAGVENQYFASFVEPVPPPRTQEERWDSRAVAVVLHADKDALQKADVGVEIISKPVAVGPNRRVVQSYRVFAGPKTPDALAPFGAEGLASYRKYQLFSIPGASWMAFNVISPLLDRIYALTAEVAQLFGGKAGSYGIAIILLTITVRMLMFPIGFKQALMSKKMQDLQPHMKEIQEKYKDNKEQLGRETMALYSRHGVNPVAGCLPALIQLPIFVGLWQALNNSVHLRHARFLWIENLAAPDMLFKFPFPIPLIGGFLGDYFNVLPLVVVSLMLVQTKLFAPPATTPEAEAQQKMMKYMMVFMGFMFYKVPSGLGLYFITSSLWSIGERLLLPKFTRSAAPPRPEADEELPPGGGGKGRGGPGGNGNGAGPARKGGWLSQKIEKLLDEAAKDPTIRNAGLLPGKDKDPGKDKGKPLRPPGPAAIDGKWGVEGGEWGAGI